MIKIENHCVGCTDIGLHCIGSACSYRRVEVIYCDKCRNEIGYDEDYVEEGDEHYHTDCYEELFGGDEQ